MFSWLGRTDLNASKDNAQVGLGPLAQAVQQRCFDRLILLNNYPKAEADAYLHWLESLFPSLKFEVQHIGLSGPTNYDEIYRSVFPILEKIKKTHPHTTFTFDLSPGTPAMAAVWIILAKTYFPAELIESSREHGVKTVNFLRVGTTQPISLDIRVIAATNRDLIKEVQQEHFRADLFYRLAVAVLKLPALRHRPGDLSLLIDSLLLQVNTESHTEPGYQEKQIIPSAKNILLQHTWPGNVRELLNTLRRAAIWSDGPSITPEDVLEALLPALQSNPSSDILNHTLENPIDLPKIMGHVAEQYIQQALEKTGGNKTKAAQLLGLKSYQTLNNWMEKYGIGENE